MDSMSNFVKRIPVEIQDVRFKSNNNSSDPARNSTDPARRQLGDPYPTTEGKPYGVSENSPAARGVPGINTDLHPVDTGQVAGGA